MKTSADFMFCLLMVELRGFFLCETQRAIKNQNNASRRNFKCRTQSGTCKIFPRFLLLAFVRGQFCVNKYNFSPSTTDVGLDSENKKPQNGRDAKTSDSLGELEKDFSLGLC